MSDEEVLGRFRAELRVDLARGERRPLEHYLSRFGVARGLIAAEYERLTSAIAASEDLLRRLREEDPGRYRDEDEEVARGSMGAIFKIHDEVLGRDLAMKVLLDEFGAPADAEPSIATHRFLEEAQITAQLDHPGVVPVHDLGIDEHGHAFFRMKLVRGRTLDEIFALASRGVENWTQASVLRLLVRVCDTLAYAHNKGVVHRDLKPDNVMVGDFGEVYVMDWGLAKVISSDPETDPRASIVRTARAAESSAPNSPLRTALGQVVGTPVYMPPEQAGGDRVAIDARADVYAVGAMMYELLTGCAPYAEPGTSRDALDVLHAIRAGPPKPIAELAPSASPELKAIAERGMARDRERRYTNARELSGELQRYLDGRVVHAYGGGPLAQLFKWMQRNRALAAASGAAILFLVAGLIVALRLNVHARRERDSAREASYRAIMSAVSANVALRQTSALRVNLAAAPEDLRGWEWHIFAARVPGVALTSLPFRHAAFDPDNRLILSGFGGDVYVADARGRDLRQVVAPLADGPAMFIQLPPGGTRLLRAPAGDSLDLEVWNTETGQLIARHRFRGTSRVLANYDGTRAWVLREGEPRREGVVDLETGRPLVTIEPAPEEAFKFIRWSGDGRRIVGSTGQVLRILDAESLKDVVRIDHPGVPVIATFSPDASKVVTTADGWLRCWDAISGRPAGFGAIHLGVGFADLSIRYDGALLAAACWDGTIRFLDMETGETERVLESFGAVGVLFSRDGTILASPEPRSNTWLWDLAARDPYVLKGHRSYVYPVALSPDGKRIASGGWDGYVNAPGCIRIWDAATGDPIAAWGERDQSTWALAFSPDGTLLFTCGPSVADYSMGRLAIGDLTGIQVWDASTGALRKTFEGEYQRLAVSPDGNRVIGKLFKGAVVLDVATGRPLARLGADGPSSACAFSPDNRLIATGSGAKIQMWRASDHSLRHTLSDGHTDRVQWASFSPDGRRLLSAGRDGLVCVWDCETGTRVATLEGHGTEVLCAVFSADQTRIFSGGRDRYVRVWDADKYEGICHLAGHDAYVFSLAFSGNGGVLVSGSGDGTVRIWTPEPPRTRFDARQRRLLATRELTPLVESLFEQLSDPSAVVERLVADHTLSGERREWALQLAMRAAVARR